MTKQIFLAMLVMPALAMCACGGGGSNNTPHGVQLTVPTRLVVLPGQ